MEYSVNKPYPKVAVSEPNLAYASLLLEDYAGVVSEQTAINQYLYQAFAKFSNNPEFYQMLLGIAKVEMKHFEILGQTIHLLGAKPKLKFIDVTGKHLDYWQGKFVDYTTNMEKMLIDNIKKEYMAISKYEKHIAMINDKYIKRSLARIIEDEKIHIICFKNYLSKVVKREGS